MEQLYFINANGVVGHTESWSTDEFEWEAFSWIEEYGKKIGRGVVPLPSGGFIDLSQFATVAMRK